MPNNDGMCRRQRSLSRQAVTARTSQYCQGNIIEVELGGLWLEHLTLSRENPVSNPPASVSTLGQFNLLSSETGIASQLIGVGIGVYRSARG